PYDGLVFALAAGGLLITGAIRPAAGATRKRHLGGCGLAIAAGLPLAAVFLAQNIAVTGNPLVPAYAAFNAQWPGAIIVGFGKGVFDVTHTPALALSKELVVLARLNLWFFGWPISLLPLFLVILGLGRDRAALKLLAIVGLHLAAYFF